MDRVTENLNGMGLDQLMLALVFLASYAVALGKLTDARGRLYAAVVALLSAGGFVWMGSSWEGSVVLVAIASLGVGGAVGGAWLLWRAAMWHAPRLAPARFSNSGYMQAGAMPFDAVQPAGAPVEVASPKSTRAPLVTRLRARWRIS